MALERPSYGTSITGFGNRRRTFLSKTLVSYTNASSFGIIPARSCETRRRARQRSIEPVLCDDVNPLRVVAHPR